MPPLVRPGGPAEKLGNRYEGIFLARCVLDLLDGRISALVVESFDSDEAAGVELTRIGREGQSEFWSVKRQRSEGPFTFAALRKPQPTLPNGVWGAAVAKIEGDSNASLTFISQNVNQELEQLPALAQVSADGRELRLEAMSTPLAKQYEHLRTTCRDSDELVWRVLRNFKVQAFTEKEAAEYVELQIRLVLRGEGTEVDPHSVRLLLADFVLDQLGTAIKLESVVDFLHSHRLAINNGPYRDFRVELDRWNRPILEQISQSLIAGKLVPRLHVAQLGGAVIDGAPLTVLAGGGGFGKSSVLAGLTEKLGAEGIQFAFLRLDSLTPMSTRSLGEQMGLSESPAIVMGRTGPAALIIDQVDAVSSTSGRNSSLQSLLLSLLSEAAANDSLRVVLACRSFDLEFDETLKRMTTSAERVDLGPLEDAELALALQAAGVERSALAHLPDDVLRIPRNVYLLTRISTREQSEVTSELDLLDAFWRSAELSFRNRTGSGRFKESMGHIAQQMAAHESLSIPIDALDGFEAERDALASESVISIYRDRVTFLHESLLDYVFARVVSSSNQSLTGWLTSLPEQSLFRRSQVRQILRYRRGRNEKAYLNDLEELLTSDTVRFHIKKLVLQWLSRETPRIEEWTILARVLASSDYELQPHALRVIRNSVDWFDLLFQLGVWEAWLRDEPIPADDVITLIGMPDITSARPDEVASLLLPYALVDDAWIRRTKWVLSMCRTHRGNLQALFLRMIVEGHMDDARPGFASNDDFWHFFYADATAEPAFVANVLAAWMERQMAMRLALPEAERASGHHVWPDRMSQTLEGIIKKAADRVPLDFVRAVLPQFKTALRTFGEHAFYRSTADAYSIDTLVPQALETALRAVVKTDDEAALELLGSLDPRVSHEAFLLLGAYASNPERFWPEIVQVFLENPEALTVEVQFSDFDEDTSGRGANGALQSIGDLVPDEVLADVERAILKLKPAQERKSRYVGSTSWRLLRRIPDHRLSSEGRRKLNELNRKFDVQRDVAAPIRMSSFGSVPSPIAKESLAKASDEQLVQAMLVYSEKPTRSKARHPLSGGKFQLLTDIEELAFEQPQRLLRIAIDTTANLDHQYLGCILRGAAKASTEDNLGLELETWRLIRRLHELDGWPCGSDIADAVGKMARSALPDDIIALLAWYAIYDPDPEPLQDWLSHENNLDAARDGGLWLLGSVRAQAAWAIGNVLTFHPESLEAMRGALDSLAVDRVTSVRACLAGVLVPMLALEPNRATEIFVKSTEGMPDWFLSLSPVRTFVYRAIYHGYDALRPLLFAALESSSDRSVAFAASQIALAGLADPTFDADLTQLQAGPDIVRASLAEVFAANCYDTPNAERCRKLLRQAFSDESELVRKEAAEFAWRAPIGKLVNDNELLLAFVRSPAFGSDRLGSLLYRLEDATALPTSLMVELGRRAVAVIGRDGADMSTGAASDAHTLVPLVFRAYSDCQSRSDSATLLDIIDDMLRLQWIDVERELQNFERSLRE